MTIPDILISLREKFLDLVSDTDRGRTLNPSVLPADDQIVSGTDPVENDLSAELVDLLHRVLSSSLVDSDGNVDYAVLRTSPLYKEFRERTRKLRAFDPSTLPDNDARLSFWINVYNALVLDGVIAMKVQRSIMERRLGIHFLRQAAYIVGGQRMSCDDIEHGVLRANRGHPFFPGNHFGPSDPRQKWVIEPFDRRIHFALNCASGSCPPIRVYSPEKLDAQLDLATHSYLGSDVQADKIGNRIFLSSIFKWFAIDFEGHHGIIEFILPYLSEKGEFAWLPKAPERVSLRYKPYDWSLNGKT